MFFCGFHYELENHDIYLTSSDQMRNSLFFGSFSTDTIFLDLFLIKRITSSRAGQPNHLSLSDVYLSVIQQHIQTSPHSLYCTRWKPPPFSSSLRLPVLTLLYSVSLFCSQRPSFVSVWFSVEWSREQFVYLIARINQLHTSAAPSGNAAARPKHWFQRQYQADTITTGIWSTNGSGRNRKSCQENNKTRCSALAATFEGLMRCIGHMCRLCR